MGNRVIGQKIIGNRRQAKVLFLKSCVFSTLFGVGISAFASERIVSINACTDEWLLQLAAPEKIAAVTRLNHSPDAESVLKSNPQIRIVAPSSEAVLAAVPSAVLAGPFSNPFLVAQLEKMNIPVVSLEVPQNWIDLEKTIERVAEISGKNPQQELLRKKIHALALLARSSPWKGKRAVFWSAAGHVSGLDTFENTFLATLGMQNADKLSGYHFIALEQLIAMKPEVIIVTQNPKLKNSWNHETLFHPALKQALPAVEYLYVPEEAVSCASRYTVEVIENLLKTGRP